MDAGVQALRSARSRIVAILVAFCLAFATAGPDLLQASAPRHSCCRLKHACSCHDGHSSKGQPAWSATPKCSNDCRQLANVRPNLIGAVPCSTHLTAALPDYKIAIYDGTSRVETQQ